MPFLELFDETLDINSTENYELSVQIGFDSVSFCILDTLRDKFVLLRSHEADGNSRYNINEIREIVLKDDFLTRPFKKVGIITPSAKSTVVPAPLFEDNKREVYFGFNYPVDESERILTCKPSVPDVYVLYSLAGVLTDFVRETFRTSSNVNQFVPVFHHINYNRRSLGNRYIHVNIESSFINIFVFDQDILRFCNTFNFKTVTDIQYYVLYVLKRLNIDQHENVFFSGTGANQEELLHSFSNYLANIRFALPAGEFTFSYVFSEQELNRYFNLFSAFNCG